MKRLLIIICLLFSLASQAVVNSTTSTASYTGDGVTSIYTVPYKVIASTDLVVKVNNVIKNLTTDYTVTILANTAQVNFVVAPGNTIPVVITRLMPYTQTQSLRTQGFYQPAAIENALDRIEMQIQQQVTGVIPTPVLGVFLSNTGVPAITATNTGNGNAILGNGGNGGTAIFGVGGTGAGAGIQGTGGTGSGQGGLFTGGTPNGIGVTSFGTGTGAGTSGTGGGTSGTGVIGTGGSTNGIGVQGIGNGTAVGGSFTGGATNGSGVSGTGTAGGAGILGVGGTTSGTGVSGTGGSPSGIGGTFTGTGSGVGAQIVGGLQIGSTGTSISASYGATYNIALGAIGAGTCVGSNQTLTGVSLGGVCCVSPDASLGDAAGMSVYCAVTGANTIRIVGCAPQAITSNAGNYRVRVFQP